MMKGETEAQEEYFSGGKSLFPIFSWCEMFFFLVEISILVDPKQISVVSKKWQARKKKKKKKDKACLKKWVSPAFAITYFGIEILVQLQW